MEISTLNDYIKEGMKMGVIDRDRIFNRDELQEYCAQFLKEMPDAYVKAGISPGEFKADVFRDSIISWSYARRGSQFRKSMFVYTILRADAINYQYYLTLARGVIIVSAEDGFHYYLPTDGSMGNMYKGENSIDEIARYLLDCCSYNKKLLEDCLYAALNDDPWGYSELRRKTRELSQSRDINIFGNDNTVSGRDSYRW